MPSPTSEAKPRILVVEDDPRMMVIQKGLFDVTRKGPFGDRFPLARLGEAEFFGAISTLFQNAANPLTFGW